MARPRRILYKNAVYHVTSRGSERSKIVKDDKDRWDFIRIMQDALGEHRVLCHAWVLMDNHYHLILETPDGNLPTFMSHLEELYVPPPLAQLGSGWPRSCIYQRLEIDPSCLRTLRHSSQGRGCWVWLSDPFCEGVIHECQHNRGFSS